MEALQWAMCLILAVPSAMLIPFNWLSFIGWALAVRRGHSFTPPFLCGITGAMACLLCPWHDVSRWVWLPLLFDLSILLLVAYSVFHLIARLTGLRSPFDCTPSEPPAE